MQVSTLKGQVGYGISGKAFSIISNPMEVTINNNQSVNYNFKERQESSYTISGIKGKVLSDIYYSDNLELIQDFFISEDKKTMAMRVVVKNTSDQNIKLSKIVPIKVNKDNNFLVCGGKMADWKVLRFPFNKMDIPSYYKPTTVNKDFEDAVFSQIHAIPGQGCVYDTMNTESRTVTAGPVIIFQNSNKPQMPRLMFAILAIDNHLVDIQLTTTEDRKSLKDFEVNYDFGGVSIEPESHMESHWLLIKTDSCEEDLLNAYTDAVAARHNLPKRTKKAPTVYCTWYFYTFEFTQQHLDDELAFITEHNVPIDYFQIDDGWMDYYGSYEADSEKFPDGMEAAAKKIYDAGMIPGIWACPYVIDVDSPILAKYPDIYQCKADGEKLIYDTSTNDCYVLDPTKPGSKEFIVETFEKLKGWGYRYFKLDWLRAMYEFDDAVFHDSRVNRTMAYKMSLEWIRQVLGDDCYILGCGGFSDPANVGLVDGQRICKDVKAMWEGPSETPKSGTLVNIKQNFMRSFSGRFWDCDPDGTQIRLRKTPFSPNERKCMGVYHSQGFYTEEEAFSVCIHQYVVGGLICLSERFPELQQSRLDMFRHIVPPFGGPSKILDYDHPDCPTLFLKEITPVCKELGKWWTLCIGNWEEEEITRKIRISQLGITSDSTQYAVFEFRNQKYYGLKKADDEITVTLPKHSMRILRIAPWQEKEAILLGTDLHVTGGGCEISQFTVKGNNIKGKIETDWQYPVKVTSGFRCLDRLAVCSTTIPTGQSEFTIECPKGSGSLK